MIKSKHSGWTWDLKRTPFGGSGGAPISDIAGSVGRALGPGSSGGGKGPAFNPNAGQAPQAPARDTVQELVQQRQQAQQQAQGVTQPVQQPVQQPTPVSPFVQQQRQQMMQQQMPQQMRGIGPQQPGLQSMLARILGYGGGGGGYMPQGMPPQMMQQGMPPQGYGQGMPPQGYGQQMGMPSYGQRMGAQGYRPDMSQMQQNLSRVSPSVQKQTQDAQAAQAAQAAVDAANAQQNGGGGE